MQTSFELLIWGMMGETERSLVAISKYLYLEPHVGSCRWNPHPHPPPPEGGWRLAVFTSAAARQGLWVSGETEVGDGAWGCGWNMWPLIIATGLWCFLFRILKQISTWISNNELPLNDLKVKKVNWIVCWFCWIIHCIYSCHRKRETRGGCWQLFLNRLLILLLSGSLSWVAFDPSKSDLFCGWVQCVSASPYESGLFLLHLILL